MAVRLKVGEYIKHETNIHFAYFIIPFVFLIVGGSLIYRAYDFMQKYNWWSWKGVTLPIEYVQIPMMVFGIMLSIPYIYLFLYNQTKQYIITNEKIYVKKGILNTTEVEIPLNKINDIEIRATLFERLFNTGDVLILTGNDSILRIDDIIDPHIFKSLALNTF